MNRDRIGAGIKAAVANRKKRPDYYSWIAKLRSLKSRSVKYNDDLSSDRVMANLETIEYTVSVKDFANTSKRMTRTFSVRREARDRKRELKAKGIKSIITQTHYSGDFILNQRVVR